MTNTAGSVKPDYRRFEHREVVRPTANWTPSATLPLHPAAGFAMAGASSSPEPRPLANACAAGPRPADTGIGRWPLAHRSGHPKWVLVKAIGQGAAAVTAAIKSVRKE
jgi:hypothetical protein